jgi:hexosaminidase
LYIAGILLDTSRNFFSVEVLKRLIDGLSYNKLNVFHWHITDTARCKLSL